MKQITCNVAQPQWKDGRMESEKDVELRVQASLEEFGDKAKVSTRNQSVSSIVR